MSEHADLVARFAAGLTRPSLTTPNEVIALNGKGVTSRYNVYRNNVTVSLMNALASVYPATQRITGTDFFRAMARLYVRSSPPTSRILSEYGFDFPDFIDRYEYAQDYPWLSGVARIERAWLDAWHAADLAVLHAEALAETDPDLLPSVRFSPHPATHILRSGWPVTSIFSLYRDREPDENFCSNEAEDTLVTRPETDVIVTRLPPGGAAFLEYLIQGRTLSEAVTGAMDKAPDFDLSANLAGMISAGAFTAILNGEP